MVLRPARVYGVYSLQIVAIHSLTMPWENLAQALSTGKQAGTRSRHRQPTPTAMEAIFHNTFARGSMWQ